MVSVESHRRAVLAGIAPVEPLEMLVAESLGCVIADDVPARIAIPASPVAAFEGIAVRSEDITTAASSPVTLAWATGVVARGEAVQVHAGEVLPAGADAVLPTGSWRDMSGLFASTAAAVQVEVAALAGYGVWPAGHDCEVGETVVSAGTSVGPGAIALLVAAGVSRLSVIPKPRCVIVAVGDQPAADPVLGLLSAVIDAAGGHAYPVGPVRGDDSLRDVIEDQLVRADLIVICGDWPQNPDSVMAALRDLGDVTAAEVALEPAGRTWLAHIGSAAANGTGSVPVIVVPVDPWAAYVSFDAFVLPLMRELRGESAGQRPAVVAESTADVAAVTDRQRYILGRLTQEGDENRVQPLHPSRAGLLTIANCIIVLEPHMELRVGRPCSVYMLPGTR